MFRVAARSAAILTACALALGLAVAPAQAESGRPGSQSTAAVASDLLDVSGTLLVLPEEAAGHAELHDDGEVVLPEETIGGGTFVATDAGALLPLDEESLREFAGEDVVTGAQFEGEVVLPEPVADAVAEVAAEQTTFSEAETLEVVAAATADTEVELEVSSAAMTVSAAGNLPGGTHQADVVFVSRTSGQEAAPTDAHLLALMGRVSAYWAQESNGAVAAINPGSTVKRISLAASTLCNNQWTVWEQAAKALGYSGYAQYLNNTNRHLVTFIADTRCAGVGLGSVGNRLDGGVSWVNLQGYPQNGNASFGTATTAHEIGHNLGLDHANARVCSSGSDAAVNSAGQVQSPCADIEYGDLWSVMGVGVDGYTTQPAALSANQRAFLGAAPVGSVATVTSTGSSAPRSFVLKPLTSGTDLRALRVVPSVGAPFYVEYRTLSGQDSGLPWSSGQYLSFGGYRLYPAAGVKVMKSFEDSRFGLSSAVLTQKVISGGSTYYSENLGLDQSLTPDGGAMTVKVTSLSPSQATITVTEGIGGARPSISGTARVGQTLTAKAGSWGPTGIKLSYQWYRSGARITGATKSGLKLTAKDRAKKITVQITGSKSGFASVSKVSAAKTIAKGVLKAPKPKVKGTAKVGKKLSAKRGSWTAGTKFKYQWYRNGKKISGATKSTYKLKKADKGKRITVKVTGSKTGYTTKTKTSSKTKKVR